MSAFEEVRLVVGLALAAVLGYFLWTPLAIVLPAVFLVIWLQRLRGRRVS